MITFLFAHARARANIRFNNIFLASLHLRIVASRHRCSGCGWRIYQQARYCRSHECVEHYVLNLYDYRIDFFFCIFFLLSCRDFCIERLRMLKSVLLIVCMRPAGIFFIEWTAFVNSESFIRAIVLSMRYYGEGWWGQRRDWSWWWDKILLMISIVFSVHS